MCDRLWGRAWSKAFQRQTVAITLVVLGPAHQIASVGASVSWLCLQMRPSGMWSKGLVDSTQQELKDTKENKQQSGLTRECKRPKKCIPNKCFCARKRDRWKRPFSSLWLRRRPPPQRHRRMLCPCLQREWKSCSCNRSAVSIELWKQPKMAACSTVILVVNLFLTAKRVKYEAKDQQRIAAMSGRKKEEQNKCSLQQWNFRSLGARKIWCDANLQRSVLPLVHVSDPRYVN